MKAGAVMKELKSTTEEWQFCPLPSQRLMVSRLKSGKYIFTVLGLEMQCASCKEYWPADTEFFFPQKNKDGGLHCWCKACYTNRRYPNGRHQYDLQVAA